MQNERKQKWVASGILTVKGFAAFDRLRQKTFQAMEAALPLRGCDYKRDFEPWPYLGIWMGRDKPDLFAMHVSAGRFHLICKVRLSLRIRINQDMQRTH
jgi:hypothetical protein